MRANYTYLFCFSHQLTNTSHEQILILAAFQIPEKRQNLMHCHINGPLREKKWFCCMWTLNGQTSLCIPAVWSETWYKISQFYLVSRSITDYFCKQFEHRSGQTECRFCSKSKHFDTLIVFSKDFLKKLLLKKVSRWQYKCKKLLSMQK